MIKHILVAATLAALPAAVCAAPMAAPAGALPKCTAKVQDSCDQSMTTEKNAIDHYPADTRDAGNNKIGGMHSAMAMPMDKPMMHKRMMHPKGHGMAMKKPMDKTAEPPMTPDAAK